MPDLLVECDVPCCVSAWLRAARKRGNEAFVPAEHTGVPYRASRLTPIRLELESGNALGSQLPFRSRDASDSRTTMNRLYHREQLPY